VDIVQEPQRRDTFPAIALSCAYLALEKKVPYDDVVLVLPVDPYADMEYFNTLGLMEAVTRQGIADLVLMGIKPTYPSAKYGYIMPHTEQMLQTQDGIQAYPVKNFIEKPSESKAEELISEGAVWNGGVFAFRLGYLMEIINASFIDKAVNLNSFDAIYNNYELFTKISFDYEVVEKAASIAMIPYTGIWKDLGTWNTLSEEMESSYIGQVTSGEETENTNIINELSIPIVALGCKDMIIAASPDGILISDKQKSSYIKSYVESLGERPMYEERSWGDYKVLDFNQNHVGEKTITKQLTINAGQSICYRSHRMRDEVWIIAGGYGLLVVEDETRMVKRGDVAYITKGQKHALKALGDQNLSCIEIQMGSDLTMSDIQIFPWEWHSSGMDTIQAVI
jgi:mannose-1-phosphate guanylyltransferase